MKVADDNEISATLRRLPSIDTLLREEKIRDLVQSAGAEQSAAIAREQVDSLRTDIQGSSLFATQTSEELLDEAVRRIARAWRAKQNMGTRRVINATGVILHTNLGRASLSEDARNALRDTASGYCTVEYDLETGDRGKRGVCAEELLTDLTGAESAIVVNNCAAAAFLVLSVFGSGGEAVISRGELVEIGGDFRVPDVLEQSGTKLREVGATNRTKLADYEKGIGPDTRLLLRVHPSNYRIIGFTSSVSNTALVDLAHAHGLIMYEDAGSGAFPEISDLLDDEPVISRSIQNGVDLVSFSGDKLLGGPQCGLIVGRRNLIEKLRNDPLYRALRVGKLIYAALEATLRSYARGTAITDIPVLRMLAATYDTLEERCRSFVQRYPGSGDFVFDIVHGHSVVGGGSAPDTHPSSPLIAISHPAISAEGLTAMLRNSKPPVIARIEKDRVHLDLRTVSVEDECELLAALTHFEGQNPS
ncbi:MAG: L-seryl-tRNA(Sec) selenium transferase [Acidobacteriota bacterium]